MHAGWSRPTNRGQPPAAVGALAQVGPNRERTARPSPVDCRWGTRWRARREGWRQRRVPTARSGPDRAGNLGKGAERVSDKGERGPRLPPRWFIRVAWTTHRAIYRVSGGRVGLWRPKPGRWGTLRLTTTGRRSGRPRSVIVGYFEDGPNLVTLAMNGWADPEPAWWLNLQTQPDATVELGGETRAVRARAAQGAERSRLWARWSDIDPQLDLDAYAAKRSSPTAVVILEPRPASP
jgi:F420H(2)-dependent quinone reductase